MSYRETEHLRVLIANERKDRLAVVAPIVVALGRQSAIDIILRRFAEYQDLEGLSVAARRSSVPRAS